MPLSSQTIRRRIENGEIGMSPYWSDLLQPASIDLTLHSTFKTYPFTGQDLKVGYDHPRMIEIDLSRYTDEPQIKMMPLQFMLGSTAQTIRLPLDLAAQVGGRSGIGRVGLEVHCTAGWIDPGFDGMITLELFNKNPNPLILVPGLVLCQLVFFSLDEAAEMGYQGSYQHQSDATESKLEHRSVSHG